MTDKDPMSGSADLPTSDDRKAQPSRRDMLVASGAVAAASVITIRPALAQSTASVLTCEIPIRDTIGPDGKPVRADSPGAAPPRTFGGEDVKRALQSGRTLPGATREQTDSYLKYIRRLQQGNSGFTCFASLQNPRR